MEYWLAGLIAALFSALINGLMVLESMIRKERGTSEEEGQDSGFECAPGGDCSTYYERGKQC
jgi:hypothetical protein